MNLVDVYKYITWKIKYEAGDMPYPPVIFWKKNLGFSDIYSSWETTINYINSSNIEHNMGLYIHIPFCYTHCFFCTCVTQVSHKEEEYEEYLDMLELESKKFTELFSGIQFNTVYVGGGTPTILTPIQLDRFYNILKKYFNLNTVYQIMTEGSPYTTTIDKLNILKKHGVNKMTFGVQSLDGDTLKQNNRAQQVHHVTEAVKNARSIGIKHINLDIMAGLPEQSFEGFRETIRIIEEEIKPTTVHVNAFLPTKNTLFDKRGSKYTMDDIILRNKMRKFGNFLEEKKQNLQGSLLTHNVQLYNAKNFNSSILGLGYGAISHGFGSIHYTKPSYSEYKEWLLHDVPISFSGQKLTFDDEIRTYAINHLRGGIYEEKFKVLFGLKIQESCIFSILESLSKIGRVFQGADDQGGFYKSLDDSDIITTIYSKFFYSENVTRKCIEVFLKDAPNPSETALKLKQFFTD